MKKINCLIFPGGERIIFHRKPKHCWILMSGECYEWKYREMKMGFAEFKKRYVDIKK